MKNSSIYVFSIFPVFNKDKSPAFETFDQEHSVNLYSALALNHKEIACKLSESSDLIFCFDKDDEGHLPDSYKGVENIVFVNPDNALKILQEKYFRLYNNNIIIFSNSIGISPEDFNNAFNLLSIEDEAIVLGKSINQRLAFIGFNSFNAAIFEDVELHDLDFDFFLNKISKFENFIHILDNFMLIKNIDDFKNLYHQLSKKESFAYCSQEIHEKFTNLFIEYKDLLK
jgi:hypothetical protein